LLLANLITSIFHLFGETVKILPKTIVGKFKRGFAPLFNFSPSPLKERGIKGVRLARTLYQCQIGSY
jgi:hypothetical protein